MNPACAQPLRGSLAAHIASKSLLMDFPTHPAPIVATNAPLKTRVQGGWVLASLDRRPCAVLSRS